MQVLKKNLLNLFALCILLSFAGCGNKATKSESSNGSKKDSIVFGIATELNNFDPFSAMTADARSVNFNLFDGLVNVSQDGGFNPAIAESYTVSDDAKTYSFSLRNGVKFHDGSDLCHADVLYSIQKAIESSLSGYNKIKDFHITEDGHLIINLSDADTGFIAYLTTPIVKENAQNLALSPVGTGPYKLAEYVEQDHLTLEKNEDYWGQKANLKKIIIKFIDNQANMILNFQAGSIDAFSANADSVEQLGNKDVTKYQRNSNSVQLLALNNAVAPFDDVRVRKAINYLVDADEIIKTVNYGYGVKTGSPLIPALVKYYNSDVDDDYNLNIDKARSLLKEAGYENGFSFSITIPSAYTVHVRTGEVIVNQLSKAGIKASIKQVDWASWLQNVYTDRQYESTIISVDGSLAYPTAFLSRYCSNASNNFVNFKSEAYDAIYEKAVRTVNEEDKIAYFKDAQRILSEESASVYIEDIATLTVYKKEFAGNRDYPLYVTDFSAVYAVDN
ncbi:MAG: hypothetical protein K6G00_02970 [Treponema sp.]|nr:hypothetical protein [Treponema sp.]